MTTEDRQRQRVIRAVRSRARLRWAIAFYVTAYIAYLALCWVVATQSWQAGMAMLTVQYCWSAWRILEMVLRGR
jgi:cell division septal protein FtsQ